jgi:hypothetical protein
MEQRGGPYVLERNYAAGPDERGKRPQGGTGLGQILQDRSANCCVEEFAAREASDVAFDETHAGKPAFATRDRAVAIVAGSRSTPTTSPEGPTSLAASNATSATPEPMSSTRCPGPMPASRKRRSVKGSQIAA